MKIQARKLYELFPTFNQFCSSPMDSAMSVKLMLSAKALRPYYQEIERGYNEIFRKHASRDPNDENKLKVLPAQFDKFSAEIETYFEKLGEMKITRPAILFEDLRKFGCPTSPNQLEIITELCVDDMPT